MLENENWYVLYTKPHKEKVVTSKLTGRGITAYCPMVKTVRQWSDRKKKIEAPLIPSCVFVFCKESERAYVFEVPGVSHYLFWLGKPAIVKNSEIKIMQEWLMGHVDEAHVQELKTGDHFILQKDGFSGQEGIVNEVSKNRIQIVLKEMGMKITLKRR
jgi:transcription antitermination factor NusG